MRLHLEECLVDGDEAGDVQHPSWVEVLQLQTPLVEEPTQKPVHGETTLLGRGCGNSSLSGTLQCATSFDGKSPFPTKAFNTDSLTVDDLQSDISLRDRKRICEFLFSPSLSPLSFLETTMALKNALGKKEKERRRQMRKRQKNRVKTFSLLLLKEKGTTVRGGHAVRER